MYLLNGTMVLSETKRSVETSRMTSQTTLIASPMRPDGTCECRRCVTCTMDDAWRESSRHRKSQETVTGRFLSLLSGRWRLAAAGWSKGA
ncbi:hypothetical protein EVAR_41461_1 [Eumeta japonica]|uniref:Uncharacterized protein n=1 Tax=Eumeta variegata TaxID=151549 RepID=A0A4C1X3K4_EUMVA|nr:hypothetical protein EVAR_41461_1 [Eumeta japonica]